MPERKTALVLAAGAYHDFSAFGETAAQLLEPRGLAVELSDDPARLAHLGGSDFDLVILYTCLGAGENDRRVRHLSENETDALIDWVRAGGGLLALHGGIVMDESNRNLHDLLGGRFTGHPAPFAFTVYPMARRHPITEGIDAFVVREEFYLVDYRPDIDIHMVAVDRGVCMPVLWSRDEGTGRVVVNCLGHGPSTWEHASYRQLVLQSLSWMDDVRTRTETQ